jgi:hypothetical protein
MAALARPWRQIDRHPAIVTGGLVALLLLHLTSKRGDFWLEMLDHLVANGGELEPLNQRGVGHAAGLAHGLQPIAAAGIFQCSEKIA